MDTIERIDTVDRHHNQPPLSERLGLDHAALLKRAKEAEELVPSEIRAIETEEEAAAYTDTAADIKEVIAEADAAFTKEKAPWLAGGRAVDDFFSFRKNLQAAVTRVVTALNKRQALLIAAERKRVAEEAERERKEAEAFDEPLPPSTPVVAPKEAARIVSSSGRKASGGLKWAHRVVDPDQVPRQYLMVNDAAIKAAIAGGTRAIPGVEIFEEVRTTIRR